MTTINSSSLFHFTKKKASLVSILKKGLRYSYCYEEVSHNKGLAIPMICFCDIPLFRTKNHRKRYGNYVIGLNKKELLQEQAGWLNPVHYKESFFLSLFQEESYKNYLEIVDNLTSNENINKYIGSHPDLQEIISKEGIEEAFKDDDFKYHIEKLSFLKMYCRYSIGFSKKMSYINKSGIMINNYDEREWRLVLPYGNPGSIEWDFHITQNDYENSKSKLLEENKNTYLTISTDRLLNVISHIIVKTDDDISQIIDLIMRSKQLFGCTNISEKKRLCLISKITSFERIEKDY